MADDVKRTPEEGGRIVDEPIGEALAKRYLAYALSTITSRALPDVRDGLKPVHRRVLYAMSRLRLGPDAAFRKSAKVVGDVMGDYHPHGDQSIYDALVRLARDGFVRADAVDDASLEQRLGIAGVAGDEERRRSLHDHRHVPRRMSGRRYGEHIAALGQRHPLVKRTERE